MNTHRKTPRYIGFYSTTETADTAYFIGGHNALNMVVKYTTINGSDKWIPLPDLNKGRFGHGSIIVEDRILIIGGWNTEVVE